MAGPRTTVEAQAFYRMYHSYADILNPWDRMRWCRYSLGLLQKDVAAMVGMEEWLYRDLESGTFHRSFTPELADKLAALYGIPVEDILDDYTLFLRRGGGDFLRRYRESKGWNRQQLADHAKVSLFLFYLRCILSLPGGFQIFQQRPAHHRAGSFGKRQPQRPAAGRLQRTGHHTGAAKCLHHQLL